MFAGVFEVPAWLLAWFYSFTNSYILAIGLIAVVVMALVTPLTLKSTKGMLEMQKLAPELRKLQQEHRNDRQKLNEEMMKLYQEHKVNPMASCLPILAQSPVFIIMFRILHGLTYEPAGGNRLVAQAVLRAGGADAAAVENVGFIPRYVGNDTKLYESLQGASEMNSIGLDLSLSPADALGQSLGLGLLYALLVVALGALYFAQQRMVAARAAMSPTMSPGQQKLMQYLPVAFAIFQIFFLLGLVVYYMVQTVLRIVQQAYITRRFYGHEDSLGRQAQRASEHARELAKKDGGGGGMFAQARKDLAGAKQPAKQSSKPEPRKGRGAGDTTPKGPGPSKRTTAPKNRPTSTRAAAANRTPSNRPGGNAKRRKKR